MVLANSKVAGCSIQTQPSLQTVLFLLPLLNTLIPVQLGEASSSPSRATGGWQPSLRCQLLRLSLVGGGVMLVVLLVTAVAVAVADADVSQLLILAADHADNHNNSHVPECYVPE